MFLRLQPMPPPPSPPVPHCGSIGVLWQVPQGFMLSNQFLGSACQSSLEWGSSHKPFMFSHGLKKIRMTGRWKKQFSAKKPTQTKTRNPNEVKLDGLTQKNLFDYTLPDFITFGFVYTVYNVHTVLCVEVFHPKPLVSQKLFLHCIYAVHTVHNNGSLPSPALCLSSFCVAGTGFDC